MNLVVVIASLIAIVFAIWWASHKLKDTKEGGLIDIGLRTYVTRSAFEVRVAVGLIALSFVLLLGLWWQ